MDKLTREQINTLWMKLNYGGNNVYNGRQIILTPDETDYLTGLIPVDMLD